MKTQYTALLAVALPSFVYGIYRFSIGVVVPEMENTFGIHDSTMGAVISISVGTVGIGVFLAGYAAERYGAGPTLLSGLVIFLCPLIVISSGVGFETFSALFLISSFGSGLLIPPSFSIIAVLLPQRRGIGAGFVTSAYNIGGLVGPAVVGYLLLYYDWQGWFLLIALTAVLTFVIFFVVLGRSTRTVVRSTSRGMLLSIVSDRKVQVLALAAMLADAGFVTYLSWTPKFLLTTFNISGSSTAVVDSVYGLGFGIGGLGVFSAGYLFEKIGGRKTAILGGVIGGLASGGAYLSGSIFLSLAFVLLGSFFLNWFWSLLTVMTQISVSEEKRAISVSFVQTVAFVGAFVGPGLAGALGGAEPLPLIATVSVPYLMYALVMVLMFK